MAFLQGTLEFPSWNLKILVCSEMICDRDQMSLEHFISNLAEFKKSTGSRIYVTHNIQVHNIVSFNLFVKHHAVSHWNKLYA